MPDGKVDIDECPLDLCDAPVDLAIKSTSGIKFAVEDLAHDRVCVDTTTVECEEGTMLALLVVYHELDE